MTCRDHAPDLNASAGRVRLTLTCLMQTFRWRIHRRGRTGLSYLKGVPTGRFKAALAVPLGSKAGGLSPSTIRRLVVKASPQRSPLAQAPASRQPASSLS